MPDTCGQLIEQLRESRLDEPKEGHFRDHEIRKWLNQGAREIARKTEFLQTFATQAVTATVQQYTAPVDTIRIYRVEYIDAANGSVPLQFRDFNNMDSVWWSQQLTVQGTPELFTMWGFPPTLKIILYPTPSVAGTLKVYYYKFPTDLAVDGSADGQSFDIPAGWDDCLLDYAEYCALRKDRDPRWQEAKSLFEEKVGIAFDLTRRYSDQAGMMVSEGGGGGMVPRWIWDENY